MNERFMRRALQLAEMGCFSTAPNPRVGCVIVKDDKIIGEGFHDFAGNPHAEVHALKEAGAHAKGAIAYVTLEPCAHFGRTPPCAQALIDAGVHHVVIATTDPNPLVKGKGIAMLENAGIRTTVGVCEQEALALNRGFFKRMRTNRPFVTLKIAASMDGRTALANGQSQWITGDKSREDVHKQRLLADAVIAGTGSILHDNARLTARITTPLPRKEPLRVIIDSKQKTPAEAAIFVDDLPVVLFSTLPPQKAYPAHCTVVCAPALDNNKVDLGFVLNYLGEQGVNNVLVEAGEKLAGAFLDSGLVDEILLYLAPCFLGADGRSMAKITPLEALSARIRTQIVDSRAMGEDWRFTLSLL